MQSISNMQLVVCKVCRLEAERILRYRKQMFELLGLGYPRSRRGVQVRTIRDDARSGVVLQPNHVWGRELTSYIEITGGWCGGYILIDLSAADVCLSSTLVGVLVNFDI